MKHLKDRLTQFWHQRKRTSYIGLYTVLFSFMCLCVFIYFFHYRRSFIFGYDGVPQHANALAYYGDYLRDIFKTLWTEHKLIFPMWDMRIGYGSDILTTLQYYVIGDPLTVTAVFVPKQYTELLYILLVLLRFYLMGLSFSAYCAYHKKERIYTLTGAMVYCFCGYALFAGMRHPFFINPMLYLPIILIGIDKIFAKKKPYLFIGSIFIAAASNFYFFYMICIMIFIYAVFRYIYLFKKVKCKEVLPWMGKFIGFFCIGFCMACFLFLPSVMTLLETGRMSAARNTPLFYDRAYYESFLIHFITGKSPGYWSTMAYTPVVLTAVLILLIKGKQYKALRNAFLLLTLFLLIPWAGSMLNGFSYVANRWIWAYSMLNAYILVELLPKFFTLNQKEKTKLAFMSIGYILLCVFLQYGRKERGYAAIGLFAVLLFLILINLELRRPAFQKLLLLSLTCICIVWNAYVLYSVQTDNYTNSYIALNSFQDRMFGALPSDLVQKVENDSIFRYAQYNTDEPLNSAMQQGLYSTSFYFSVADSAVSQFYDEMYMNYHLEQRYSGLDQRTILNTLASVKYFITRKSSQNLIPFQYKTDVLDEIRLFNVQYQLYQGKNTLPLGYTYDSYMPRKAYEQQTVTQKQMTLLQACVLEESTFAIARPSFNDVVIPYTVAASKNAVLEDGRIVAKKAGASITLQFDGLAQAETYLILENVHIESIPPLELYTEKEWNQKSVLEQHVDQNATAYWKAADMHSIKLSSGKVNKTMSIATEYRNGYSGKVNFLCNMGYTKVPKTELVITLPQAAVYSFDDLRIVCQPALGLSSYIDQRKEAVLENLVLDKNRITGTLQSSTDKILLLAVPYSKGWTAKVDGEPAKIQKANTMFMAVELDAGTHSLEFSYRTPYLKEGLWLSAAGLLAFAGVCIVYRRKNPAAADR